MQDRIQITVKKTKEKVWLEYGLSNRQGWRQRTVKVDDNVDERSKGKYKKLHGRQNEKQ